MEGLVILSNYFFKSILSNENKSPNNVSLALYTGQHLTCSLNIRLSQNLYRSTTSLYRVAIAIIKLLFYSMLTASMTFAFTSDFFVFLFL